MITITKALEGKVSVPDISAMSISEIEQEIVSYTEEDLLNSDTLDRLGELRIHSTTFGQNRLIAKERVQKRIMDRMKKRAQRKEEKAA